jgi:hypothetical protein
VEVRASDTLPAEVARAVQEVTCTVETRIIPQKDGDPIAVRTIKTRVKLHSKLDSLKQLREHLRMDTGGNTGEWSPSEELKLLLLAVRQSGKRPLLPEGMARAMRDVPPAPGAGEHQTTSPPPPPLPTPRLPQERLSSPHPT